VSGVVVLLATVSLVGTARADITSWFAVYGGATSLGEQGAARAAAPLLQLETGAGSSPAGSLVFGGLLKSLTAFGRGTDLALTARVATGGFVRGGWGGALDVGPYRRWWGVQSSGVLGQLVVGAPFGLQLTAFTEQGTHEARAYGAALGIDLLRLTVYRSNAQSSWYNPILPAGVDR
jgi:hypothetical protein